MGTRTIHEVAWLILAAALVGDACRSAEDPAPPRGEAAAAPDAPPWEGAADGAPAADALAADVAADAQGADEGPAVVRLPGWSVRKRLRPREGTDLVLEEVLASFADATPPPARIRKLSADGERSWTAPVGQALSDLCSHDSGEVSAILVAPDRTVSLVRLAPDLTPLGTMPMHDALIAGDPHVDGTGEQDLRTSGLTWEAARVAGAGETTVAVVATSWNSVVAYRVSFAGGAWAALERTLVEPPAPLIPFLPTSGTFDTFGAMVIWYRPLLDLDGEGNAFVAIWAGPTRIRQHAAHFGDGLAPLFGGHGPPDFGESDVLVTKLDRSGARLWSRVVGTAHEDEPYALRAAGGTVAVVGRARRFPGFDNTAWDAFLAVLSPDGAPVGSRVVVLDQSAIFLAVDPVPGGGWLVAGSDGWSQNPDGLSVLSFGHKLLAWLPALDGPLSRIPVEDGPRHNELRTVIARPGQVLFGGHEDGPIMHTGDGDRRLITATGLLGHLPLTSPVGPALSARRR